MVTSVSEKSVTFVSKVKQGYKFSKKDAASSFIVEVSTPDMEGVGFSETLVTTPRRLTTSRPSILNLSRLSTAVPVKNIKTVDVLKFCACHKIVLWSKDILHSLNLLRM